MSSSRFAVSNRTAKVVHAIVPVALVALGVAKAEDRAAWLTAFAKLFGSIAGTILLGAAAMDVGGFLACAAGLGYRPCQPHKTMPKQRLAEAFETARSCWVFAALAAWPAYFYARGEKTALVFSLAEAQPEAPTALGLYVAKLFLVTLLVDAYMYFKHRMLHSRPLFAFHADHHRYHDPSPFAAFAVAPVEAVMTYWPVLSLSYPQLPVWAHAYMVWVAGFVMLNLYLHAGWQHPVLELLLRAVCLNSSAFHNVHHAKTKVNFGELCYLWDALLGTGAHPGGMFELSTKTDKKAA